MIPDKPESAKVERKRYEPSKTWVVVSDQSIVRKLASVGLGLGRAIDDADDRLYGTCFVACFLSRKIAADYIKALPQKWPGLRIIPVMLSEMETPPLPQSAPRAIRGDLRQEGE